MNIKNDSCIVHTPECDKCSNEKCKQAVSIANDETQTTFVVSYYSEKSSLLFTDNSVCARPLFLIPDRLQQSVENNLLCIVKNTIKKCKFPKADFTSIVTAENLAKTIRFEWRIKEIMDYKDILDT